MSRKNAYEVEIAAVAHGDSDNQSQNPVKFGGVARTTNPTAVDNGDRVNATFDDVGRQITVPYQVRDLIATASATTSTLAEVTLFAGTAGEFHDLIEMTCANTCGAAVTIDVRDTTGGTAVKRIQLAANATEGRDFQIPVPQNVAADAWTIQNAGSGDISTTQVTCTALFIKNV